MDHQVNINFIFILTGIDIRVYLQPIACPDGEIGKRCGLRSR